jgi:hypothetical protein
LTFQLSSLGFTENDVSCIENGRQAFLLKCQTEQIDASNYFSSDSDEEEEKTSSTEKKNFPTDERNSHKEETEISV